MNKHTNIIQVTAHYPPHLGGMGNCVKAIADKLNEKQYHVQVITSNIKNGDDYISKSKYPVAYLKSIEIAHTPIIFFLILKLLLIPKNSIIHLHIAQAYVPEIVYLISKIKNIPYIAHVHIDVDPSGRFGFLLQPYKKIILAEVLKNASRIICLSNSQKEIIVKKYKLQKKYIEIIPNGVSKSFFVKRTIVKKEVPTVLFVGRLSPQKNIPRLIKAVSLMKQKVHLQIVGRGEEYKKIKKLIKELNLSNITILGKKIDKELIKIYKQADIFALPSNKEGVPLVLLEAMAAGLPIVASDIYGVNELLNNTGILVQKPSPKTFAIALDKLITDIEMQKKLSQKAQKKARLFSWNNILAKIEKIYKEINYAN